MVDEKIVEELEKLGIEERIKKLKELEKQREKELDEIKSLINKNIREIESEEKKAQAQQPEAKKAEAEEAEEKSTALEDVVKDEKATAPASAVEYGRPIAQRGLDVGSLYEEVKKFREEVRDALTQGYQLNQREEGELYQLKKMVEQVEIAQSYVKAPKVQNELLSKTEEILENIQQYRVKKTVKEVTSY